MDGLARTEGKHPLPPPPTACFDSWLDRTHIFVTSQTQRKELAGTLLLLLRFSLSQTSFFIGANATEAVGAKDIGFGSWMTLCGLNEKVRVSHFGGELESRLREVTERVGVEEIKEKAQRSP